MNNLFKNAYFSKEYKTRDGRKAIYWKYESLERWHILIMDNSLLTAVFSNGKMCSQMDCDRDIVSEWQEEINEDELDELLAEQNYPYPLYDKSDRCVAHSNDGLTKVL